MPFSPITVVSWNCSTVKLSSLRKPSASSSACMLRTKSLCLAPAGVQLPLGPFGLDSLDGTGNTAYLESSSLSSFPKHSFPAFTQFFFSAGLNDGSFSHLQDCHPLVFPLPFQSLRDSSIPSIPPLTLPPLCLASPSLPNPVWFSLSLQNYVAYLNWLILLNLCIFIARVIENAWTMASDKPQSKLGSTPWEFLFCFTLGWLFHFYFYGKIKIRILLDFFWEKSQVQMA